MKMPLGHLVRASFWCLVIASGLTLARSEVQTITDKQGRSIKADVLAVEDGQVRIKREDGQTFNLALSTLSESDQKRLKEWAAVEAAKPKEIPADSIEIKFSRAQFKTEKQSSDGATVSKEQWGYNIDLINRTSIDMSDVRAEYILFVKQDDLPGQPKSDRGEDLKRMKNKTEIAGLGMRAETKFRTEPVVIFRQTLKPGYVWSGAGGTKPIRDNLYGLWMKVYVGKQLVSEVVYPESLSKTEKW